MKIRNGFVSNSSSSSFCIYGICIDECDIEEALIKKGIATKEDLEDGLYDYIDDWSFKYDLKQKGLSEEEIKAKLEKRPLAGLEYEDVMGCAQYLGASWKSIRDDETGAEFKNRIQTKLKEIFGDDIECSTHEEAWRDG